MLIRDAIEDDSEQVLALLRRSITELCIADHNNDPAALHAWLRNKTAAAFEDWLVNSDLIKIVAEYEGQVAGFGMATIKGEVLLNYVSPEHRFRGVSTAVLAKLEQCLFERGVDALTLWSTETAHDFYASRGWRDHGAPEIDNGSYSYPMVKSGSL